MRLLDFERHLRKQGCEKEREGGKHTIYHNPKNNVNTSVPRHKEIRLSTVKAICKQLGILAPM